MEEQLSGRLPLQRAPYTLTGLVQGVLPTAQTCCGSCGVCDITRTMWDLALVAVGFTVATMACADPVFARLMTAYIINTKVLTDGRTVGKMLPSTVYVLSD